MNREEILKYKDRKCIRCHRLKLIRNFWGKSKVCIRCLINEEKLLPPLHIN